MKKLNFEEIYNSVKERSNHWIIKLCLFYTYNIITVYKNENNYKDLGGIFKLMEK
jgi:hypothetical protein